MSTNGNTLHSGSSESQSAQEFSSFCQELSHAGRVYLERVTRAIDEVAPWPGFLVYVVAKNLQIRPNCPERVVFSAIDAHTFLQVARAYQSMTIATAVSFIEFAVRHFPFKICQIRTPARMPFCTPTGVQPHSDFSAIMRARDFSHSLILDSSRDILCSITSRLVFGGITEGTMVHLSSQELQTELDRFLFFHNNYRFVPWLEGKTPLQRLNSFEGFSKFHSFGMDEECARWFGSPEGATREMKVRAKDAPRNSRTNCGAIQIALMH